MNKNKILRTISLIAVCSLLLASTPLTAAQQGHLKVTSKVQKMVIVNQDGKKSYKFLPTGKVLPGEIVQYNTFYENIGNKAADNINIVNPIPKHLVYLPKSAQGSNTNIVFSIDGGKRYGKAETLKVKGSDGKWYPAKPSNYTHIKWQYRGSLAPKQRHTVAFRARLK